MKFKKHISLFLAFLLLVSNVGLAFNVHYCGGEIASITLKTVVEQTSEENCCGVIENSTSCCNDKIIHLEKKSDNAIVKGFSFQPDIPFLIQEDQPIVFSAIKNFKNTAPESYHCNANAPPLFKLYSQYIFYA